MYGPVGRAWLERRGEDGSSAFESGVLIAVLMLIVLLAAVALRQPLVNVLETGIKAVAGTP